MCKWFAWGSRQKMQFERAGLAADGMPESATREAFGRISKLRIRLLVKGSGSA